MRNNPEKKGSWVGVNLPLPGKIMIHELAVLRLEFGYVFSEQAKRVINLKTTEAY
jgi:hypothetical protein